MNILVVDDEPFVLSSMARLIRSQYASCEVEEAEDGEGAIKILQRKNIDLVITDIRMPGMDGLELASNISVNHPSTVAVLLTGYAEFDYAVAAIRQGVFDYLLKPISKESLMQTVERVKHYLTQRKVQDGIDKSKPSDSTHRLIRSSLEWIAEQYASPELTLASIAEKYFVNPNYLSGLFKSETGLTFTQHLTNYRLEAAKQLLRETNLKIYEICEKAGYTDQAYFSRLFKAVEGMTPYEYRESYCSLGDEHLK
ncbi:response regulator transcription factor [Paenibacillus alkalitolerans]|uniref:response regulator transcription factor n=1 Tax=Paenibacillus alkalitolerans TaxID=2799335 RepID=UPI0018F64E84|nr:response regulator [Paenibacillus alkalitolerans]